MWWTTHQAAYTHVAALARKYLAIPDSSAPSERVFSITSSGVSRISARGVLNMKYEARYEKWGALQVRYEKWVPLFGAQQIRYR